MSIQEKELKGVLKSLKAINASLGTVAATTLMEDVDDVITDEAALNAALDLIKVMLGADGTSSIAELSVLLHAQLE